MIYNLREARILTVRPPMSHAIAWLDKDIENASRALRKLWGSDGVNTLLIHAGLTYDHGQARKITGMGHTIPPNVTYGAIIAVVNVAKVCTYYVDHPNATQPCFCTSPWAERGRTHLHLADLFRLPKPLPATGALGIRHPTAADRAKVADQIPTSWEHS